MSLHLSPLWLDLLSYSTVPISCSIIYYFIVDILVLCMQVHTECRKQYNGYCTLGELQSAILPPSVLQKSDSIRKGMWEVCLV